MKKLCRPLLSVSYYEVFLNLSKYILLCIAKFSLTTHNEASIWSLDQSFLCKTVLQYEVKTELLRSCLPHNRRMKFLCYNSLSTNYKENLLRIVTIWYWYWSTKFKFRKIWYWYRRTKFKIRSRYRSTKFKLSICTN